MPPSAGLCDTCRHQRIVRNTRGSSFSLCERSRTEPEYPRYPRLPVVRCAGHEPRDADTHSQQGSDPDTHSRQVPGT